ncbi:hypothetical protein BV898_07921 [Hypsibius exemplaris]|uniref:Receptor ligand binding region domain-containing protein n=1 Tax=Hypsibius exemplaris TaxID=2072580 RepID=A0A1W0WS00_HYPEX|nr:hypothetical protein BV898_07921 [Hypsibius exemplaris]
MYRDTFDITHTMLMNPDWMDCQTVSHNCDDMVAKYFYRRTRLPNMTALIIPGCTDAALLNKLAAQWDVLLLTGAVTDPVIHDKRLTPTWISTTPLNYISVVSLYVTLLERYRWSTVHIVGDLAASPFYSATAGALSDALSRMPPGRYQILLRWINSAAAKDFSQVVLDEFRRRSRVFLFFGHAASLKTLLIYVGLETFHNLAFGKFSWNEFDPGVDPILRKAVRSLLLVSLATSVTAKNKTIIDDLERQWIGLSRERYNYSYSLTEKVPPYASSCYAAVEIFAQVLNSTIALEPWFNFSDGKSFARRFFNRTLRTTVADVHLDEAGERHAELVLRAFVQDPEGPNISLTDVALMPSRGVLLELSPIQWSNGHGPPANTPKCGYSLEEQLSTCPSGSSSYDVVVGASVSCGMILALVLMSGAAYFRLRKSRYDWSNWWLVNAKLLILHKPMRGLSIMS